MKLKEKALAIKLRKRGLMITTIATYLKVSKSTVGLWLRDLPIGSLQKEKILRGRRKSRFAAGRAKSNKRIETTKRLFDEGRIEGSSRVSDSLFVSGSMLYWAEGAKSTENIKFSNSDPAMIVLMMSWFREICKIPEAKFRACIHIHSLHSRTHAESYWSKVTGIPKSQFYKTQIKKTTLGHRRNKLYEGTCTISIGNKNLFRKMQGWRAGILEKFGVKVSL